MKLTGKVALVTGSTRGIGFAIAKKFAENGASVIINGSLDKQSMSLASDYFSKNNYKFKLIMTDVSDYEKTCEMINSIIKIYGRLDILVNNAAVSYVGLFTDMTYADYVKITNINQFSVYNCCHIALPLMVKEKSGVIINISSMWGSLGASCEAVYSASKGAVNTFTKAIAKEYAPCNIRCNAISCGVIETDMNSWLSNDERSALIADIPINRFGRCEDVANAALFLSSDDSAYITGQIINVDGGIQ